MDNEYLQEKFLQAYARTGNIAASCKVAGCTPVTLAKYRDTHPEFKEKFDEAYDAFCAKLEAEGLRRAVQGIEEPVFYQGQVVGERRYYSDRLLELYLKCHIPKYRDKIDVSHQVAVGVLVVPGLIMSAEKWEQKFGSMTLPMPDEDEDLPPMIDVTSSETDINEDDDGVSDQADE